MTAAQDSSSFKPKLLVSPRVCGFGCGVKRSRGIRAQVPSYPGTLVPTLPFRDIRCHARVETVREMWLKWLTLILGALSRYGHVERGYYRLFVPDPSSC